MFSPPWSSKGRECRRQPVGGADGRWRAELDYRCHSSVLMLASICCKRVESLVCGRAHRISRLKYSTRFVLEEVVMKNPVLAACLALVICFSVSTARAADWSNDTFSCDLTIVSTGWVPWEWGLWTEVKMKFYQNVKPASTIVYTCALLYPRHNSNFGCFRSDTAAQSFPGWYNIGVVAQKLNPGVNKSQACEALFGSVFHKLSQYGWITK